MIPALIAAGAAIGGAVINNKMAQNQQKDARKENYMYGEMAAKNADIRTRALYNDFYSPQALMNQYQQAGLSPSMMFGGTPGQGGATGAMGTGANGPGAVYAPISMLEAAQAANLMAQTEKTKAETKTIEETRTPTVDKLVAEVKQTLASAGATEAAQYYTESQTSYQKLINYITDQTKEPQIRQVYYLSEKTEYESKRTMYEALTAGVQYDFESDTFEGRKAAILLENQEAITRITKNKEETKQIQEAIKQAWKNIDMQKWTNEIQDAKNELDWRKFEDDWKNKAEFFVKNWEMQLEVFMANYSLEERKMLTQMATSMFSSIVSAGAK